MTAGTEAVIPAFAELGGRAGHTTSLEKSQKTSLSVFLPIIGPYLASQEAGKCLLAGW